MTIYDPVRQRTINWGESDFTKIGNFSYKTDSLQSLIDRKDGYTAAGRLIRHSQRWRLKRAIRRRHQQLARWVEEVHKQLVSFLCTNYNIILLPNFNYHTFGKHANGGKRLTSRKSMRNMQHWAHGKFESRLRAKAATRIDANNNPFTLVMEANESYTSKTCGRCGYLHHGLGGAKIYRCQKIGCGGVFDRDANGARNIAIRAFNAMHVFRNSSLAVPSTNDDCNHRSEDGDVDMEV